MKVLYGAYGSTSSIVNVHTGTTSHERQPLEADVRSFSVFFLVPPDRQDFIVQKGLLFFQNIGPYGVKDWLTKELRSFFSSEYDITFDCRCVSPAAFLEKVLIRENLNKYRND